MLLLELIQGLAGYDLDDAAEHIGRIAITPQCARLTRQRQSGDSLGEHVVIKPALENPCFGIRFVDPLASNIFIADLRRMSEQIHHSDGPVWRHELQRWRAIRGSSFYADLHAGEGRNEFGYGILQRKLSRIDQHHGSDAGYGFGHRMERENRIRRHREPSCDIAHAEALQIDGTAMLLYQDDGARQFSRGNLVIEERANALELCWRRSRRIAGLTCRGPDRHRNSGHKNSSNP